MDPPSETNSIRSVGSIPTSMKAPNSTSPGSKKQVGFAKARPHLIIPPPQIYQQQLPQQGNNSRPATAATIVTIGPSPYMYGRKASVFMFDQFHGIRDFTKSGLGMGEKCAYWLYSKVRDLSRKWFTHMFLTIVLLLYTIGGALVFEFVEGRNEEKDKRDLRQIRQFLIGNLSQSWSETKTVEEYKGLAASQIQEHERFILDYASKHNNKLYILADEDVKQWNFLNASVFCMTVYTTMGYGHIVPSTTTGQALTIVYAIIGIPLFLIALTDFGKLFTRGIKFVWSYVRRVYYTGSCRKVRKNTGVEGIFKGAQMMYDIATFRKSFSDPEIPVPPATEDVAADGTTTDGTPTTPAISNFEIDDEFNLPITLAIIILIIYIFLGSVGYMLIEEWEFARSFYFVFISMSTIGFGDLVPKNPICLILSIVYLVFGLALTSMCINVVQAKLSDTFKQASSKIGATIGINVDEEEEGVEGVGEDGVPGNDKGDAGDVRVGEESDKPSDKPETSKGKENLASPEDTSSDMVRSESNGTTKSS